MTLLRAPAAAFYFVLLVWLAWTSGKDDPDWGAALIIVVWLAWIGGSLIVGRLLGPPALALPLFAVALAAVVGEVRGVFDADTRLLRWVVLIVGSLISVGFGAWLARDRAEEAAPAPSSSASRRRRG
jgi:hypothetical protein